MLIYLLTLFYKHVTKRIFFLFEPETIHNLVSSKAQLIGNSPVVNNLFSKLFAYKSPVLKQKIKGITFDGPIGLAAGFDYDAKVYKILPSLGFGWNTIGTISNLPYEGNKKPRLGRLPKSKSLMVNKGFKNLGAIKTAEKLASQTFKAPLGISIGQTNTKDIETQKNAIVDILQAFEVFKNANIKNAYYELNISCPNLKTKINFYRSKNLDELLSAVDEVKLKKPLFIKMPINETDTNTLKMLDVIVRHKVTGVIFGNLQKDRDNPALVKEEIKWPMGGFSGLPTQKRSDELITLAYKKYGKKLIIVGCGGIFNAEDAYRKIKLGASLLQLITGLIYEGPLLVAQINRELPKLLKNDGFKNISEAIGVKSIKTES